MDPARCAGGAALGRGAQEIEILLRLAVIRELGGAGFVELEVARIDEEIDAREMADLLELGRRTFRLHRASPRQEVDVARPASAERRKRVVRNVGLRELLGIAHQDARDVDRDVADADHGGSLAVEIDRKVEEVGMAAVPGDESRRRKTVRAVLARNAEPAIALPADRQDDLVVVALEVGERDVAPELDVAEEADPRVERQSFEDAHDLLDLRMVGRDAVAHEPVRCRQPVDEIDRDRDLFLRDERRRGVEARRPGPDDRHPQRPLQAPQLGIHARDDSAAEERGMPAVRGLTRPRICPRLAAR